jgi:NADPH-dependent F420 reductase
MRIGILGSGSVGSALAAAWLRAGHDVVVGTRDPSKLGESAAPRTDVSTAARESDVVVLATPWHATPDLLATLRDALDGKVVIDCTNPLTPTLSGLTVGGETSAGEQVQSLLPRAKVVKAFNTTGAGNMAEARAHYLDGRPMMPYAGDDDAAKDVVRGLVEDAGFEPVDAGGLDAARLLEPMALLWIRLAYAQGLGTGFAYGVLRRS